MKFLITLILFASFQVYANWYPVGKSGAATVYTKKDKCEQVEGQLCLDITGKDPRYHNIIQVEVDDLNRPKFSDKYNVVSCGTAENCIEKMSEHLDKQLEQNLEDRYCDKDIRDVLTYSKNKLMPGYSYYCYQHIGYEKKIENQLQEDSAKKSEVEAEMLAAKAKSDGMALVKKKMAQGKELIAFINMLQAPKNLTPAQIKTMLQTYSDIKAMLETGALQSAREEIVGVDPDAVIVTSSDKTAILAELDKYLAQ